MSVVFVSPQWRVLEEGDKFIVQLNNNMLSSKPAYENCHVEPFDSLDDAILYIASMLVNTAYYSVE